VLRFAVASPAEVGALPTRRRDAFANLKSPGTNVTAAPDPSSSIAKHDTPEMSLGERASVWRRPWVTKPSGLLFGLHDIDNLIRCVYIAI